MEKESTDSHVDTEVVVEIRQRIDAVRARQEAAILARAHGFSRVKAHEIATSVSELAQNVVSHARSGGQVELRILRRGEDVGFEVVTTDGGPGISDVELALTDGFSTAGTLGGGLPGARRLMGELEVDSAPGRGTRVVARKWKKCR